MGLHDSRVDEARATLLAFIGMSCLLLTLVVRLFNVQVLQHHKFERLALENQFRVKRVVAPRGVIRDRNGKSLVDNVAEYELNVEPAALGRGSPLLAALGRDFDVDSTAARARWEAQKARGRGQGSLPVKVLDHLSKEQLSRFEENVALYPGAELVARGRRRYIYSDFATHVLGYVGEVSPEQVEGSTGPRAYRLGDLAGKAGIETLCEDDLRGFDGARRVQVNALGQELFELPEKAAPPVPGQDIYLTIDYDLQQAIETQFWPPECAGAAVVMDVHSGDLLAAVSKPGFDLNRFSAGISTPEYEVLRNDPLTPLFNRYARATYAPGSTFKIVSATAYLDNGVVRPEQVMQPCHGSYRVGNHVFKCWEKKGHGALSLFGGFTQSCDVYFYQSARILGIDRLARTARHLGLGAATGFDLPEDRGLIPDSGYYDRMLGKRGWTTTVAVNCIIGQGEVLVTPLQMARLAAGVANGGHLLKPQIVHRVVDAGGRVLRESEAQAAAEPVFDARTDSFLRRAMLGVVIDERGTGHQALPDSILVAGKTGTAECPGKKQSHAWFVFFAPFDQPQIAGAIIVERAGHGGSVAAPIARQIVSHYFGIPDRGPAYWRRFAELRSAGFTARGAP